MTSAPLTKKPKLLCVDDDVDVTYSIERLLRGDFDIMTVNSVADAKIKMSEHSDLAIILTDHNMPGGSGLDLLTLAQQQRPEAVRAMLTAHVDLQELVSAINKSLVHRLILKPWDTDYLRVQMLEALAIHEVLKEKFELERLAMTDPVTHRRNHRFFQEQLKIEVARSLRHGRDLSLIMIDIDHFKKFNDQHGHPAGDRLLRDVGTRLTDAVRNLDTVARYGGEEFAILLPDTPAADALLVAERIRESFGSTLVTVSLGIATCPSNADAAPSLVTSADAALYRAKDQGRNQSVVAETLRP